MKLKEIIYKYIHKNCNINRKNKFPYDIKTQKNKMNPIIFIKSSINHT